MKFNLIISLLIIGLVGLVAVRKALDVNARPQTGPAWVKQPRSQWPPIALRHQAEFRDLDDLDKGTACLVELPDGKVVAATARPLLKASFIKARESWVDWRLEAAGSSHRSVRVTNIIDRAEHLSSAEDTLLLSVETPRAQLPAEILKPRREPPLVGERVVVVASAGADEEVRQKFHPAEISLVVFGALGVSFKHPVRLEEVVGAPVLDTNGLLVAVVIDTRNQPDNEGRFRNFVARSTESLNEKARSRVRRQREKPSSGSAGFLTQ